MQGPYPSLKILPVVKLAKSPFPGKVPYLQALGMKTHSILSFEHTFIEHLLFWGWYLTLTFSGTLQADVETNR